MLSAANAPDFRVARDSLKRKSTRTGTEFASPKTQKRKYRMKIKTLVAAVIIAASGLTMWAQDNSTTSVTQSTTVNSTTTPEQLFNANELSMDLFGTASVNQETIDHISGARVHHNGRLGAGAGLTYYATRYLGIGGDGYSEDTHHWFVDDASGNLYLRLPLDAVHLAPYIYGGGGHPLDPTYTWFGQAGAGLDIRVTRHWGFFADARYVMPEHAGNFGVGRVGLRLLF
jgi:hypothetical protein